MKSDWALKAWPCSQINSTMRRKRSKGTSVENDENAMSRLSRVRAWARCSILLQFVGDNWSQWKARSKKAARSHEVTHFDTFWVMQGRIKVWMALGCSGSCLAFAIKDRPGSQSLETTWDNMRQHALAHNTLIVPIVPTESLDLWHRYSGKSVVAATKCHFQMLQYLQCRTRQVASLGTRGTVGHVSLPLPQHLVVSMRFFHRTKRSWQPELIDCSTAPHILQ